MAEPQQAETEEPLDFSEESPAPESRASFGQTVLRWVLKLGLPVAIFVFLFWSGRLKFEDLDDLATRWPWTLAALSMLIPAVMVCALRFKLLLKALDIHTGFGENIALSMIGMLFDLIAPVSNGGDVIKAFYLNRSAGAPNEKRGLRRILFAVVIDRIVGMFSLFVLALLVSAAAWSQIEAHPNLRKMAAFVMLACVGGVLGFFVLVSERLENSALRKRLMHRLPFHEKLERIYAGFAGLRHHKRILAAMVGLSLVNHAFNCACFILLAQGIQFTSVTTGAPAELDIIPCLTVLPLGMFLNTFGFAGGFGVGTMAIDELFRSILKLKGGAHLALAYQLTGLLFRLLGIPFLIFYKHNRPNLAPVPGVKQS